MSNNNINNVDYLHRNFQAKEAASNDPEWIPLRLPGDDYIPGNQLFPARVIAGYSASDEEFNEESWAKYVLEKAKAFSAGTACASFSGEAAPFKLGP
jgi:hypothetical protein